MTFLLAGDFLPLVEMYRLVWIRGRFGGGKTSLAFALAEGFLKRGYSLLTNVRCVWADEGDITPDDKGRYHAVVVFDEGGLYLKASRMAESMASYARKMDVIYIVPSFWPPTRAMQVLVVQPVISFVSAGIPVIIYKWSVRLGDFKDKGFFLWLNPSDIYGVYDTLDPGDLSDSLYKKLLDMTEVYRRVYGRDSKATEQVESDMSWVDEFAMASDTLAEALEGAGRLGRRRR